MKIGAVSLWLLLLLSERPMYGYELIRELEKRFSGYWKPKTGTIYPALEKLEQSRFVTSRMEFREEGSDRKHYALTTSGEAELSTSMQYWTKMSEVLESYREIHESIFRHKEDVRKGDFVGTLMRLSSALEKKSFDVSEVFPGEKHVTIEPADVLRLKFLYAKENQKLEIHMEFEWTPQQRADRRMTGGSELGATES